MKRTKIVCTLGPASETVETIRAMVAAGMNVARLNFSHGTYRHHAMLIRRIRQVEKETVQSIGILQDLQGPKIRVGEIPKNGILLRAGKTVTFVSGTGRYAAAHHLIPVPYPLAHFVGQNQRILFDDGKFAGRVLSVSGNRIAVQIDVGGRLLPHKGINIPDSKLTIPALTEKDKKDVAFGVRQGISIFALSFVSRAKDIHELRRLVSHIQKEMKIKKHPVQIIAKIERRAAFDHLEEIFTAVDGIMVARGDLGIEMPVAEVPVLQKDLIALARKYGKPVIVATQMLDSMQERPAPTRAEVSDIANAVIDHADAVMLSNESAVGRYPVRAVQTMYDVIREAEKSRYDDLLIQKESWFKSHPQKQLLQKVLHECGGKKKPEAIVIVAKTGAPVRELSRLRREVPLIAVLPDEHLARQAALLWGVTPVAAPRIFKKKHINLDSVLPLLAPVALDKSTVFLIEENSPKS